MDRIGILHSSNSLRKLIIENPDLPIVVLADENANIDYGGWMYCSDVHCNIGYILDVRTPYDVDTLFTDEDDFEEAIQEYLYYEEMGLTEEEHEAKIKAELEKYKPYWRKVIAIYASN